MIPAQIFGIQHTTAGRAAFLVQLTTVAVPLLEAAISRRSPPAATLGACAMAFAGVTLLLTASPAGAGAPSGSTAQGDALIVLAALACVGEELDFTGLYASHEVY